jgi:hypothetical protein
VHETVHTIKNIKEKENLGDILINSFEVADAKVALSDFILITAQERVAQFLYRGGHQSCALFTSDFGKFSMVALPLFAIHQLLWGIERKDLLNHSSTALYV